MKKIIIPFEYIKPRKVAKIYLLWIILILGFWIFNSFVGDTHLFPPINKVYNGYIELIQDFDLIPHIFKTIGLSLKSVFISIILSMFIVYLSPLQILRPLAKIVSQLRYLPFAGLTFYMSIIFSTGTTLQTSILVVFTTTFLVTSLLSYLNDIPQEEFDNAKTMGLTRWEVLWEVVIIGRLDYVFESIRQNLAIVTMSIVTVESILATNGGIGFLINSQSKLGNHGNMVAIQLMILLATIFLDYSINYLRKRLFPYSNF